MFRDQFVINEATCSSCGDTVRHCRCRESRGDFLPVPGLNAAYDAPQERHVPQGHRGLTLNASERSDYLPLPTMDWGAEARERRAGDITANRQETVVHNNDGDYLPLPTIDWAAEARRQRY